MRNRWTVEKDLVIGWRVTLPGEWRAEVLRWGEETGVFRVSAERPLAGSSVLAYLDDAGTVVQREVADFSELPRGGRPVYRAPLDLLPSVEPDGTVDLWVSSCTDIWLPWSAARYELDAHPDDLADNRELARRHTPRLNEFLGRLRVLAESTGGSLSVNEDVTDPLFRFQLDDRGVRLDAENPYERSTWEPFDAPGERDLAGALRRTLRRLANNPVPAPYRAVIGAFTGGVREQAAVLAELRRAGLTRAELTGVTRVMVRTGRTVHHFDAAEVSRLDGC